MSRGGSDNLYFLESDLIVEAKVDIAVLASVWFACVETFSTLFSNRKPDFQLSGIAN